MRVEMPTSTAEAAALIRDTAGLAVLIRGAGTKLSWGPPASHTELILDTSKMAGMVEHAAGDLITVVRAGTPMSEIDLPGQQLALESPVAGATVGGTLAVNVSGPRRLLYGTARDLLIGITVVRPDGVIAKAGGKVVKNVAGYDLGKLFIGSYGTLGLITECVFRLHPRPAATAVVRAPADTPADVGRLVAAVLAAQVVPSAIEVDAPGGGPLELAVLVEGVPDGVADRVAVLRKVLGDAATEGVPPWWGQLPFADGQIGLKLTSPISGVPALLEAAGETVAMRGSAGTGVVHGCASDPDVVEQLRAAATHLGGHAVVLTAPDHLRDGLDMWGPVGGLALMRRVKAQFDPGRRFSPGRFVGGI